MASETPLILLKTLLMIVFTSFPDPDEIAGHVDSGEIVSIDFMVRILTNIEECVEMISLRLATDSPDGKCLHNFFNPLRLLDCRFLRCPLPAIEKHWSAGSLAVEKLYRQLHTAAIANTTSIDISPLLTADYLQPPSFGMIRNWLRDVRVTKVAIVEDIEDASFSPLKMVLILPTAMIQAIVSGEIVDFSAFPQTQVNFALTLAGALHKIGHWIRQNCFPSWNVPLSMMIAPLVQSQTSFIAKDPLTFRGGLLHWHNQSYVCATTLLSSIVPFGTLSLAQRNRSIVFDLRCHCETLLDTSTVIVRNTIGCTFDICRCPRLRQIATLHQCPPLTLMDLRQTFLEIVVGTKSPKALPRRCHQLTLRWLAMPLPSKPKIERLQHCKAQALRPQRLWHLQILTAFFTALMIWCIDHWSQDLSLICWIDCKICWM